MKRYKINRPPWPRSEIAESNDGTLLKLDDIQVMADEISLAASAIRTRTDDAIAHKLIDRIHFLLGRVQS